MGKPYLEFCRLFEAAAHRHGYRRLFDDFLTVGICTYHWQNFATRLQVPNPENEAEYLQAIKGYDKKELDSFARMLAVLGEAVLVDEYSDILGEFFTEYITRGHNGQYFTPDAICDLMARLTMSDPKPVGQRVCDPTSGSGRMLLKYAKLAPDNYFYAADVDSACAKMTCLNMFLNGLRGQVSWMNTLTLDHYRSWEINGAGIGIMPISQEKSEILKKASVRSVTRQEPPRSEPPAVAVPMSPLPSESRRITPPGQLTLF